MKRKSLRFSVLLLAVCLLFSTVPCYAAVRYMPDVTNEMSSADSWAARMPDADRVLMTPEQIRARNAASIEAAGTKLVDMKNPPETFDGIKQNHSLTASAKADAEYYFGWIYDQNMNIANWSFFQKMISNCTDYSASHEQPVRLAIAVERTELLAFPTHELLRDETTDLDFDYNALVGINIGEPLWLYSTSWDRQFYLAQSASCSGWVRAEDVAICKDREEWLGAWDIPDDELLVVTGSSAYTAVSLTCPAASNRRLALGTKLRRVEYTSVDGLINNRSSFHSYIVELPVRDKKGNYQTVSALIPETAPVSEGYLPLTKRNIAKVMLSNLGDAYGWGGMMGVEDCSGLIRQVYHCFGLELARNTTWQCNMPVPKIDMNNMSVEEKRWIIDQLPLGTILTFNGHEMLYMGKVDGKYYVASTVGSVKDPDDASKVLRARSVMINTLDVLRANGHTWLQEIIQATLVAEPDGYPLPQTLWYHDAVAYCLKNELLHTKEDGSFGLQDTVCRAELADALWRMAGKPETDAELSFEDVPAESSFTAAIKWAADAGVMVGYDDGRFGADDKLTREQATTVLFRFAQQQGITLTAGSAEALYPFRDRYKIHSYALDAMRWACASGILRGSNGLLDPQSSLTRVQLAALLEQYSHVFAAEPTEEPVQE